jgi:hypothetical protein
MSQGVDQKAVDNFMISVDTDIPLNVHFLNLNYDRKAYKWNADTVKAIQDGIRDIFQMDYELTER